MNFIKAYASYILLSFFLISSPGFAEDLSPQNETNKTTPLIDNSEALYPQGIVTLPSGDHFSPYVFVVGKKERTLWVFERDGELLKLVEKFDTDIGKNSGDKSKENDFKTPAGIYFLQKKMSPPEIPFNLYGSLAFTTDYPNIFDRRDAKTGSGIWLHAIPDSVPLTRGSRGCVVVRNEVIKKIEPYVKLKQTPLVIFNEVKFLKRQEYLDQQKKYIDFFQTWNTVWQDQDVDSYIRFYDGTFRNDQMNYNQWYRHKKNLKKLYKFIKVKLTAPLIIHNKDQIVIRTLQSYESDLHKDFGEKTLHARATTNDGLFGFKIIREDWQSLNSND